MRQLNVRDPLTQLFNRRYVETQAHNEWRRAMRMHVPLSIAIADIDHFKQLNDTAGHACGDQALVRVADVLRSCFQRAGDSVCRHGGEEFSILLPQTSRERAVSSLRKARDELHRHYIPHPGRANAPLTFSVGVTTFASVDALETHDFSSALRQADAALYAAKQQGRDRVVHYQDLPTQDRFLRRQAADSAV